jgi:WD40 repeat protein/serine/threonine protein kinase
MNHDQGQRGSSGSASRNLLFGIIALQNNFITREQLIAAFDLWVHDKSRSLPDILAQQAALPEEDRGFLNGLVARFLKKHGGDSEKSLAALSPVPQVRPELERLNDPDLGASLGHVGQNAASDPRLEVMLPLGAVSERSLGRFRILRPHVKGGLGLVSVALDQELNREVALKEIQPRHADDQLSRERFVLEAEITGSLEHPGIVPVYALGQSPDGRPFYAMRFVKGDSLKEAIEAFHKPDNFNRKDPDARQLELRQLLGRFIDVCNAMEFAHSRGVLHRDLKPGNIMVGKYGETLVVDWGLAKIGGKKDLVSDEATLRPSSALSNSGQTQPGSAIGTPAYMSPEQAAGKLDEIGPASDIYSLGATLYHLLCGKAPFEKEELDRILAKVKRGEFAYPKSVVPDVSTTLEAICLKAMALKPSDRYPTARALVDDLESYLAGAPVSGILSTKGRAALVRALETGDYREFSLAVTSFEQALDLWKENVAAREGLSEARLAHAKCALRKGDFELGLAIVDQDDPAHGDEIAKLRAAQKERDSRQKRLKSMRRAVAAFAAMILLGATVSAIFVNQQRKIAVDARDEAVKSATAASKAMQEALVARDVAATAQKEEELAKLAAENERQARVATERQLRTATAERLAALSHTMRSESPEISILLGVESGRATRHDDEGLLPSSHQALLDALSGIGGRPLIGHQAAITSVAISPNNRWVVTASDDTTARIWDVTSDSPAANPYILRGHRDRITSIAITADSHWVVTAGEDNTARVWDLTAEDPAAKHSTLNAFSGIQSLAVSPDNHWLLAGCARPVGLAIWDVKTAPQAANAWYLDAAPIGCSKVAISPDGHWYVAASAKDRSLWVHHLTTDGFVKPIPALGHLDGITDLAISSDSHWLVTASADRTARVWELVAETPVMPAKESRVLSGHEGRISSVAISSNKRWVVTGSDDTTARVWDLNAATPVLGRRILNGHEAAINVVAISADSRWVLTGSADRTARVWDLATPGADPRILRGHHGAITALAVSSDSRWAITAGADGSARLWNLADDQAANPSILMAPRERLISLEIHDDHFWTIASDRYAEQTVRVWDLGKHNTGAYPKALTGHEGPVTSAATSSNSRWLFTGSKDGTIRVWDLAAEDPAVGARVLRGQEGGITSLAINPDASRLVTASPDKTAWIWDLVANDHRVLSGHGGPVNTVAISADGNRIVTGSDDKTARVWDLTAEEPASTARVLLGHSDRITSVAISPDSRWVAAGSADGTARAWNLDAPNGATNPILLLGHHDELTKIAISSDSQWLVTAGKDGAARIWDLGAEDPAASARVLRGHKGPIRNLAIGGSWILTGGDDKTVRVWLWRWDTLVALAGKVGRNFEVDEWQSVFRRDPYRKTFADLPIPGDTQSATLAKAHYRRATFCVSSGEIEEALTEYTAAIRQNPGLEQAYNARAWIQATANEGRFRDGRNAVLDATKACDLTEWKSWQFIDTLAAAYAEAGEFGQALKWQTKAHEFAPEREKGDLAKRLELYQSGTAYRAP